MKIIISGNTAPAAAPLPDAPPPVLNVIPADTLQPLENSFKALSDKVGQLEEKLLAMPAPPAPDLTPLTQSLKAVADKVQALEQKWPSLEQSLHQLSEHVQTLSQRIDVMEQKWPSLWQELTAKVKEAAQQQIQATPAATPAHDSWELLLQEHQTTFARLQKDLESGLRAAEKSLPVAPLPVVRLPEPPLPDLAQEPEKQASILSKIWRYMNQSAVEIPLSPREKHRG